jgi:hypothetical protein
MLQAEPLPNDKRTRGYARMKELAAENEAARQVEVAKLVAGLDHEPSPIELVLIGEIAALLVRGRKLREYGRDREAEAIGRLIIRAIGRLGIKPGASRPAQSAWDKYLSEAAEPANASAADGAP